MKKLIVLLSILLAGILIWGMTPRKFSVKYSDIKKDINYILVKQTATTVSNWEIIGDQNGTYDSPIPMNAKGNTPDNYNYELHTGDNTYVFYGYSNGRKEFFEEMYIEYVVNSWEILSPIKRNMTPNLLPKSYLCGFDKIM